MSEKIVNGDFANWTGGNLDTWISFSVPPASEITENPAGSCQFTSDGTMVAINQDGVLTTGVFYKYIINVTAIASGYLLVFDGISNFATLNAVKTYEFDFIARSNLFQIKRGGTPTDATIDFVSVRSLGAKGGGGGGGIGAGMGLTLR